MASVVFRVFVLQNARYPVFQRGILLRTLATNTKPANIHSQSKRRQTTGIITVPVLNAASVGDRQGGANKRTSRSRLDPDIPVFDRIDSSFDNGRKAYKSRNNTDLLRSLFVMELCNIKYITNHSKTVCMNIKLFGSCSQVGHRRSQF